MRIDFSDYESLTQKDIIEIDNTGIKCTTGEISYTECCSNFRKHHNIEGNYIGEFDCSGSNPSVCLYTAPQTTHFFFIDDDKQFRQIINSIREYGFELIDVNGKS